MEFVMANITILIVDDDINKSPKERKLFNKLEQHIRSSIQPPIDFIEKENGTEITDKELEKTDLAFIDIMLPTESEGIFLLSKLKKMGIKTIAISNKAQRNIAVDASNEADQYWDKETSKDALDNLTNKINILLSPIERNVYCAFFKGLCSKEFYDHGRHSIFVATSFDNRAFAGHIERALGNQYKVDPWTKNYADAGLLFCDKVCKKIYGNMLLIAEISDCNPNVFFEVGLGLGLGRIVILSKREGIQPLDSCFLSTLFYKEYKLISKLADKIKVILESEKVEKKSLRNVKLISSVFQDLPRFNEDKSSNAGGVLLGAENESLTEVKKYFRDNGITNVDIINIHGYKSRLRDIVKNILKYKVIIGIVPDFEKGKHSRNLMDACDVSMLLGLAVAQNIDVEVLCHNKISDYQGLIYSKENLKNYLRTMAI